MTTLVSLPLSAIHPYPNNPRVVTDADIEKVRVSIENYGYQAPIVVDQDHVIVVGHTRYAALQRLGVETVPVLVSNLTPEKAAEYRIIDNRSAELATWDNDLLIPELREFDNPDHLTMYFPEVDLTFVEDQIDDDDLAAAAANLEDRMRDSRNRTTTDITCPNCGNTFSVTT